MPVRKIVSGPDLDRMLRRNGCVAVAPVHGPCFHFFRIVCAHPVVEDNIRQRIDSLLPKGLDCLHVFLFGAIFGAHCSLGVKFTQVVHIIYTVSCIVDSPLAFVCRRHPDHGDPQILQIAGISVKPAPECTVRRKVPLKILQHGFHEPHLLA